ncbi:MAG: HAMP domain-containing histidine kinase [Actinobacteria bacterium]|nr:HAMP domain-containing histidine kinase [Actinomycetota bacterium]MBU1943647.1 HAMP domain-containing histidine kinase [Actinomycetota bacterium]MBU2686209.1 HAMP domain-containing histidine kinase [Actinomycetota bacterium]
MDSEYNPDTGSPSEKRLVTSEQRVRNIADAVSEAIIMIDQSGIITFWNPAADKIFGYTREEVLGTDVLRLVARLEDAGVFMNRLNGLVETDIPPIPDQIERIDAVRKDGAEIALDLSASGISDEDGWNLILVIRDVTEQHSREEEIRRVSQELEAYAHTISHDLRGPLSTLLTSLDLLELALDDPESGATREEIVQMIRRNVTRMYERVTGLLSLAVAGRFPSEVETVEVRSVVAEVLEDLAGQIDERSVEVRVDEDLGSLVGNRTQVAQVFSNLMTNAIAHNGHENPVVEVLLVGREDGMLRFQVRDNGPGIPEDCMERLFEPFYTVGDTGSTGLGLSLVRKIVTSYGGEIDVCNDGGACFEFTLGDIAPG